MPYKKPYQASTMKGAVTGYTPSTNGGQGTSANIPMGMHHIAKKTGKTMHPGGSKTGNVKGKYNHAASDKEFTC